MATYVVPPPDAPRWAAACGRRAVALLDADPDLAADLPADEAGAARARAQVAVEELRVGEWDPVALGVSPAFGLLVLDGLLLRTVDVEGRVRSEAIGPGDVLRPWDEECIDTLPLAYTCRWDVVTPARLALLDAHLAPLITRWPQIAAELLRRSVARSRRLALQLAVDQVQGVDVRVRAMLWHLAERWGRVTPAGVVVPFALTHEVLARLVGARRPSVTSALSALTRSGDVRRLPDGGWLLAPAPVSAG